MKRDDLEIYREADIRGNRFAFSSRSDRLSIAMKFSLVTICGLDELDGHRTVGVTHVLSILDPDFPEPRLFLDFSPHRRTTLRFHDEIEPGPGRSLPQPEHIAAILEFGRVLPTPAQPGTETHLLVHCHMGLSRSTAAMAALLAQSHPDEDEDSIFMRLLQIRPKAWPNCLMVGFADDLLGRRGRLLSALGRLYSEQLKKSPHLERFMRENGRGREVDMAGGPYRDRR
jgi:predicted protein tyrosine phosphatase